MTITDIEGKVIEVTNLNEAIQQATMFANFEHVDKAFQKSDKYLRAYWADVLSKLKHLQNT
ncbi:MAG TPA: hypothetical protein VFW07_15205 [Parafilimonas sp.]|nr:hypothetical protein [Parafilimonas sp.]